MLNTPHKPLFVLLLILVGACAPIAIYNSRGLTLSEAKARSAYLEAFMSKEQVQALLGLPDKTASSTYGSATDNPWHGLEWIYRWQYGYESERLILVFATSDMTGELYLNNWSWWDY